MSMPSLPCCWRGPKARRRRPVVWLVSEPKTLDGRRNAYRILRLKDKLAAAHGEGEIMFEARWLPVGALRQGLRQMLVMVNSSRVSHLARAAGMMRRCFNEAMQAARHRKLLAAP